MTSRNLPFLVPQPALGPDIHLWAVVTQVSPLRIRLDVDTIALPFTPDSVVGNCALNDRVLVLMWANSSSSSRSYRIVIIGRMNGQDLSQIFSDILALETEQADLPRGWIAETNPTGATSVSSATEAMHADVTADLVVSRRYRISYQGQGQSTVAADLMQLRFRIATGGSVSTSDTQLRSTAQHAEVGSRNQPVIFSHVFVAASSAEYTIGISLQRNTGSGTMKLDYVVDLVEPSLVLEDIGT